MPDGIPFFYFDSNLKQIVAKLEHAFFLIVLSKSILLRLYYRAKKSPAMQGSNKFIGTLPFFNVYLSRILWFMLNKSVCIECGFHSIYHFGVSA